MLSGKHHGGNNAQKVAIYWIHSPKGQYTISGTGLFSIPEGKRKRGRLRATWRRTSEKELEDLGCPGRSSGGRRRIDDARE